ncbi:acetyl-CoA acetyltransferase [Pseudomaricurvus alkylphenolicus]|uniref:enoyl-CoA hydratase-related protein n=1 Tax=Pseudomaricurvus alkylphenolicus TaxID=1306991 RepID=UPI00141DEC0B|nr:enoyl-CoA hydratase-related protein [Pseudomaricurvus alkylphenolicus]NIB41557.1 acetyl-CoA acetyltransferase [Pseudomaricurvus alkylphenolicus]
MNTLADNTPILVGVGQVTERVPENIQEASSHVVIAAQAARIALEDTGVQNVAAKIDTVVGQRTFADSTPLSDCPFGGSRNFPRSVAGRIGADPALAIYESVGGQSPQKLVNEFSERLHNGDSKLVLLVGGEVVGNIRAAVRQKANLDWNEDPGGQLEDRGKTDGFHLITRQEFEHQLLQPIQFYGLMENARRAKQGKTLEQYGQEMAETFAGLSRVAADNPYSAFPQSYTEEELITVTEKNRMLTSPYPKNLVAKDGVNQAAALLLTTVGAARELGIDESRWIFLHGYADVGDRVLLQRPGLSRSLAMELAFEAALKKAGCNDSDINHLDIYSCFPIVVNEARDILNIAKDDPRPLTQTGGLPFFGGPGNNYSMHAIASLVDTLRADRGSLGLAYANGGWMSKHSVGIYSTQPPRETWTPSDSRPWQAQVDNLPAVEVEQQPQGEAVLETYTVNYFKGDPLNCVAVGRLKSSNKRFYAVNAFFDAETLQKVVAGNCMGETIYVEADPKGNRFAFSLGQLKKFTPEKVEHFKDTYEFCQVERRGHVLIVTIDRPQARNALHPPANEELEGIFNAYEKDKDLWAAVLTGAGSESFSAGNDMKYLASGQPMWIPKTGFAGLTSRRDRTKPVIAAVNGLALGGGLEIAMACDLVVASQEALFGLPEVKVGLFAGAGGVQRLTRQIGLKSAMEMILTGEPVDCKRALELGLINHAVPAEQVLERALALAGKICDASPVSVRSSLQLHNETSHCANVDDAVNYPHSVFDNLLNSEDFFEGSQAFAQKRKPQWRGR